MPQKTFDYRKILGICLCFLIIGCHEHSESFVSRDEILKMNPALQKVLDYYKNDEEKLCAAEFLIDNLPYHEGVVCTDLEPQKLAYQLFGSGKYTQFQSRDSVERRYGYWGVKNPRFQSDIYINPDYLIENIDWAFKVWREQPWGKNVSFEQFCEYILPYRVGNEELVPWREKIYNQFQPIIDALPNDSNKQKPTYIVTALLDTLIKEPFYFTGEISSEIRIGPSIVETRGGSCLDLADMMVYICRALGVPCGIDQMPMRGDNNAPHYVNFMEDTDGSSYYFSIHYRIPRIFHCALIRDVFGKMYRHTFGVNKEMVMEMNCPKEALFPTFRYPCFKDVTRLYTRKGCWNLKVPTNKIWGEEDTKHKDLFYLCMSNRMSWAPVDVAKIDGDTLMFDECLGGITYCVGKYDAEWDELTMVSDPFFVEKDSFRINYLTPSQETEDVTLLSKFGMVVEPFIWRMKDGVFEGSNTPDFKKVDTLYRIPVAPERLCTQIGINNPNRYRYLRYRGTDGSYCNVSEVAFYSVTNPDTPLSGKVIGPKEGEKGLRSYFNVYDGKTDTSYDHPKPNGGWAGIALDTPTQIGKIVYTPRNRDNFVRQGDTYELLAFVDGDWVSYGVQTAVSDSMLYTNVSKHTLLLLRNHSRGVAERIFEYKDGKQVYR